MKPVVLLTALALTASTTLVDSLITGLPAIAQACGAPACVYDFNTHTYIPDPNYVPPTIAPATPATPPPPPKPSVGGVNTPNGPTLGSDTTCPTCSSIPNRYSIPPVLPNVALPDLSPETVPRSAPAPRPSANEALPDLSPETVPRTVPTPQAQPSPRPSSNESPITPEQISPPVTQPQRPRPNSTTPTQPRQPRQNNAPTVTVNQGTPSAAPTRNNAAPPTQSLTTPNPTAASQPTPQPNARVGEASPTENRRDSLEPEESLTQTLTPDSTRGGDASRFWWWVLGIGGGLAALGGGSYQGHQMRQNRLKTQQSNAVAALSNLSLNLFSNPPAAKQEVKTPGPLTPKIRMAVQLHRDSGRQRLEAPGGLVDLGAINAFNPLASPLPNTVAPLNVTSFGG